MWQLVESKQKFIGQIMTSKSPVRSAEDIDETALSYAEIKALCAGDERIKEKMSLDTEVAKLKLMKASHLSQKYALEDKILKEFPQKIASLEQRIKGYETDISMASEYPTPEQGIQPMVLDNKSFSVKADAGEKILRICNSLRNTKPINAGTYRGFTIEIAFDSFSREYTLTLIGSLRHTISLGSDSIGNIQRIENCINGLDKKLETCREQLENVKTQLETAKSEVQKPFSKEEELKTKSARLSELNSILNLDEHENDIVDSDINENMPENEAPSTEQER